MSFNQVGQLYYGLANLLKVSNLRYQEIIYSLQGGLIVRTGVQGNGLKYTNKFTRKKYFLITSSGFMEMGYKYYNLHYNWISRSFGHNLGHALLQGRMRSCWDFCGFYAFDRPGQVVQHDQ